MLFAESSLDTFGIIKMVPSKPSSREWNSAHWSNGIARTFKYQPDPYDPTGWTDDHSGGTDGFRVDGAGTIQLSGSGPRFHINSLITTKVPAQRFCNIEYTAYYKRLGTGGANWGGMVVGLRSGPLGHASPGGDDCEATTYYGRFRNDGKWDFEKELKHPGSTYWSGSGYATQDPLWHGSPLPVNRWIGMKYLVYNIENSTAVKMELYIDSVSNGNPLQGGNWEKVGEVIDAGAWPAGDVGGCGYENTMIILEGGGTLLMRTDGDTAVYKMVSVREIDVSSGTHAKAARKNVLIEEEIHYHRVNGGYSITLAKPFKQAAVVRILDIQGRTHLQGIIPAGERWFTVKTNVTGIHLFTVSGAQQRYAVTVIR